MFLHLFADPAERSEELVHDEEQLQADLERFLQSYKIKQDVLHRIINGEPIAMHLYRLQEALAQELELVKDSEHAEKEILSDLKFLSRDGTIARLEELKSLLQHARTRDQYAYHLLSELQDVVESEAHKVHRLQKGEFDESTEQSLIDLLLIERHIVERLTAIEDFRELFAGLNVGEQRERSLKAVSRRLEDKLLEQMRKVEIGDDGLAKNTSDHYIAQMTARIINRLEDVVMQAVQQGSIAQHSLVDVEFVNSQRFDDLVRSEIEADRNAGKLVPSERTIRAFIGLFRQIYSGQFSRAKDSSIASASVTQ